MTYKITFKGRKDIDMHIDAESEREARWEALARLERGCKDEFRGLNTTDMVIA